MGSKKYGTGSDDKALHQLAEHLASGQPLETLWPEDKKCRGELYWRKRIGRELDRLRAWWRDSNGEPFISGKHIVLPGGKHTTGDRLNAACTAAFTRKDSATAHFLGVDRTTANRLVNAFYDDAGGKRQRHRSGRTEDTIERVGSGKHYAPGPETKNNPGLRREVAAYRTSVMFGFEGPGQDGDGGPGHLQTISPKALAKIGKKGCIVKCGGTLHQKPGRTYRQKTAYWAKRFAEENAGGPVKPKRVRPCETCGRPSVKGWRYCRYCAACGKTRLTRQGYLENRQYEKPGLFRRRKGKILKKNVRCNLAKLRELSRSLEKKRREVRKKGLKNAH